MNCKKCGHEINGEMYCPNCGQRVFGENPNDKYKTTEVGTSKKFIIGIVGLALSIFAIIFMFFPYLGLVVAIVALVLSIIGATSYRLKGFGIGGVIASVFALIFSLLFTFVFTSVLVSRSKSSKNGPEKKASSVLTTAKFLILEARYSSTPVDGVTKEGSIYTTTVTDLLDANELSKNPFENYGADGGMTIVFNEDAYEYTVTCSGTIDGYSLTYNGSTFTSKKA